MALWCEIVGSREVQPPVLADQVCPSKLAFVSPKLMTSRLEFFSKKTKQKENKMNSIVSTLFYKINLPVLLETQP